MSSKSDPRIGVKHDDHIEWPAVDINGRPYVKPPAATSGIDDQRFVILPFGYVDDGTLAELKAKYAGSSGKKPAKPAGIDADEG